MIFHYIGGEETKLTKTLVHFKSMFVIIKVKAAIKKKPYFVIDIYA